MNRFRMVLIAIALLALCGPSIRSQSQTQNQAAVSVRSRADEILEWWNQIGNKLIAMAKDFPEEKYDFKVQKDERTFADNLLHVAAVDYDLIGRVSGSNIGPDFGKDKHNPPRDLYKTKADVVKLMEQAVADGAAVIRQQGDAGLDKTTPFGWETGKHVVHNSYIWITAIEHSTEHFGQLVVYYRANNLVPPESRRDQAGEDHVREGESQRKAGQLREAKMEIETGIEIFKLNLLAYPDSADAHYNLADAYLKNEQKDLARQYAENALAMIDSRKEPLSSWSDTEQRRAEIRSGVQDTLKELNAAH